jgi:hypothetical protein
LVVEEVVVVEVVVGLALSTGYGNAESRFTITDDSDAPSRFERTLGLNTVIKKGVSSPSYGAAVIPSTICPINR